MNLPTKEEAEKILYEHVSDPYQRLHAGMVATAMEGYGKIYGEDPHLWYITGYLHDVDYEKHPDKHPGVSLEWFREWGYPEELFHAVEAHAYGYNGYATEPETPMASALIACDEMCGIFYAYQKMNPVPYGEMKLSSIQKRFNDKKFAPKIKREDIEYGCKKLGVSVEEHIQNLISYLQKL